MNLPDLAQSQPLLARGKIYLSLALIAVLGATVIALRWQGRLWWCASGDWSPWAGDIGNLHTSQHLFDPYTFTHVLHGFILCGLLGLVLPRLATQWRFVVATVFEASWEVFENTSYVINRYREATAAIGYQGDSVLNSLGDILACAAGFALAMKLGFRRAVALFILVELVLLFWIRDSLLLNIILLIYPIEAIKMWQMGR
jgi:uncharacterized protein DUF2585